MKFRPTQRQFHRPTGETDRLAGLTIPGLANCHSHAFHRALRGRTQQERGTFWTWRERMYAVAERLDPDSYLALARATYREMVASGITAVGEFHYLHHQADGTPYDDPNAMGRALQQAAHDAGLRIRLLDTAYLSSGFGEPPEGVQRAVQRRHRRRVGRAGRRTSSDAGAAIHSVRAVPDDQLRTIVEAGAGKPLHVHLSEQTAENDACVAAYGATPTQLLADHGVLGPLTSAVHATHLTDDDIGHLGATRTFACFCPTTERDLGDGIGPSRRLHDAGSPLTLGSDSHAVIDLFEEMRAVELDERLATRERGHWSAGELLRAATVDGHASLGYDDAGAIAVGDARRPGHPRHHHAPHRRHRPRRAHRRLRGHRRRRRPGRRGRQGRLHPGRRARHRPRPRRHDREALAVSTVITNIGELVTNDPQADDLLGIVTDAAVVLEGDRVAWTGPAADAPAADVHVDAGGRAVIPGFVDSHSHLVFAGDRAPEFAARMAGTPYAAGGIRTTVAATRAATDEQLTGRVAALVAEMRRQGTTTVEIKSGYGLTVRDEARSLAIARLFTDETTFLGAHVVPEGSDPDEYVALVTGPMLEACAPHARWVDVFCERGAFDEDQAREILAAGAARGPARTAARQPAGPRTRRPAGRRARPGRGRPLHLPRRRRRRGPGRQRHRRHPAAGRRVLDPPAVPRRAAPPRRRRLRRDRQRLQPGLQLHLLDAALRRPRGAGDGDDAGGGDVRRHGRRCRRPRPHRRRSPGARCPGRPGAAGRPQPRAPGLPARACPSWPAPGSPDGP